MSCEWKKRENMFFQLVVRFKKYHMQKDQRFNPLVWSERKWTQMESFAVSDCALWIALMKVFDGIPLKCVKLIFMTVNHISFKYVYKQSLINQPYKHDVLKKIKSHKLFYCSG